MRTVSRCRPNTREASLMLMPSTMHALRTRRYSSTRYIHHTFHGVGLSSMEGGVGSSFQPPSTGDRAAHQVYYCSAVYSPPVSGEAVSQRAPTHSCDPQCSDLQRCCVPWHSVIRYCGVSCYCTLRLRGQYDCRATGRKGRDRQDHARDQLGGYARQRRPDSASDRRRPTGQRSLLGEGPREVLSTEGQLGSATRRLVRQASAKPRSQV